MILRALLAGLLFTSPAQDSTRSIDVEVLDDKLVLVRVKVNDTGPHLFLLDTGGASTVLSDTLARQLGLIAADGHRESLGHVHGQDHGRSQSHVRNQSHAHRIETMSGSRTAGLTRVNTLRLGSEIFAGFEVLWMDLSNLRARDSRIQGVIGQDLLRTRSFLLDYEARRLTFDPDPASVDAAEGRRLPLDWSDGRPMVRAVVHHGAGQTSTALRFVIDSGGTHVILFENAERSPLVNALRRAAAATMTMRNHGGSRPVMTATVDRLELTEGTALRDVMTALVPVDPEQGRIEDGLLPASLFRAIYFDNRANEVVLRGR